MKKLFKWLIIIFIIIFLVILYARYVGTMGFITKEYTIDDNNIPSSFDGLKIVHFSDIHYNRAIDINKINSIVDEINNINPDIVVFTGDLIDKDVKLTDKDYQELTNSLKKINSKYGNYAIIGNHDYKQNKDKIIELFSNINFTYLDNSYDVISSNKNEKIFIGGVSTIKNNKYDNSIFKEYLDKNNIQYKIFLIHEPDIADDIVKDFSVNLILAGHSHGGQIRLPIIGPLYTPDNAKKYYNEYYNIDGTNLYISSGIGVSTVNYRLFNKPSINFYRINKEVSK